jgi:CRISPR-associated protein Cas2
MLVVVSYDVSTTTPSGKRRLSRVSKACTGYGMRVQFSVFECEVDPAQWQSLKASLLRLIEPTEDSLRFYHLGANWEGRVEHHGLKKALSTRDLLAF